MTSGLDLRPFVGWVVDEYEPSLRVGPGAGSYGRCPGADATELYGVADIACVLHTLGRLHPSEAERRAWGDALGSFHDPATGAFLERQPTHDVLHATAFAIAAAALLGLPPPPAPPDLMAAHADPAGLAPFLAGLDWRTSVWGESHKSVGLASLFALVPTPDAPAWFRAWFAAVDGRVDPATGMLGEDRAPSGDIDQIGGTFHYAFVHEHFHRRLPHPAARIDAVLGLQEPSGSWLDLSPAWLTLDAVYLLTRTARHHPHRLDDVREAVRRAVAFVADALLAPDRRGTAFGGELGAHELTATVSLLAEAQSFLGADEVVTDVPLRLVLDTRPFI